MAESFALRYQDLIRAPAVVWVSEFETTYVPMPAVVARQHPHNRFSRTIDGVTFVKLTLIVVI